MGSPPEQYDLAQLTRALAARSESQPRDYVRGKTWMRDALVDRLGCSLLEAEELVDTLEARNLVEFTGDPTQLEPATSGWSFHPNSR